MDEYGKFTKTDWIIYSIIAAIIIAICVIFGGCRTTQAGAAGYSNALIVGRLTQSVDEFDRGIELAVSKSKDITDAVDRIDSLFTEYERAALKLRDEVDNLRKQIQNKDQSNNSGINNNSNPLDSVHSNDVSDVQGN